VLEATRQIAISVAMNVIDRFIDIPAEEDKSSVLYRVLSKILAKDITKPLNESFSFIDHVSL
jgi:hypothetical protein